MSEQVNHPAHYNAHPSGVECIDVVEHMGFNLGNAVKYIWRADLKGDAAEDLRKAVWYLEREILRREVLEARDGSADSGPQLAAPSPQVRRHGHHVPPYAFPAPAPMSI